MSVICIKETVDEKINNTAHKLNNYFRFVLFAKKIETSTNTLEVYKWISMTWLVKSMHLPANCF